jgi:hypothetical protein
VKVYAYPGDRWGCGAYRVTWPAQAVAAAGLADVTVIEPGGRRVMIDIDRLTGKVARERFPRDADVVVMQRPTNAMLAQAVPLLRARGVAVVIDMDDDLSRIHPRNPAFRSLQARIPAGPGGRLVPNPHSWHNAAQACRDATLVTVTTPALAERYGAHGRVRVIPNYVPERYLSAPRVDSEVVGWGGIVGTHPDDLQTVGAAVQKLVRAGARFENVGDPIGIGRALGLPADPPSSGPVGLDEWPEAIARFGIGIAPLADTQFNQAKSRLKPLEYAAVGVPWVGSPLPDYVAFHKLGCGRIAARPKDWERELRTLMRDPSLRADLSAAGRAVAAQNTIEGHAEDWALAWADAVALARDSAVAGVGA